MKRMKSIVFMVMICLSWLMSDLTDVQAAGKQVRILVTTFPIYQITRNITKGCTSVSVAPMLPTSAGCPHDYALTPKDLAKISKADILVINGLGLEEFIGAPIMKANPSLKIIDSSYGIDNLLSYEEVEGHGAHAHHHKGSNPHLFASPKMAAKITMNIAKALSVSIPECEPLFTANAGSYSARLNALADKCTSVGMSLKNKGIVTQHGVFDYLARDMGLSVVAVIAEHPGEDPSASELLHITSTIKKNKPGALFIEPQYPPKTAWTLSKETGIPVAVLDPVATGPEHAPLSYYETVMENNLITLKKYLGN